MTADDHTPDQPTSSAYIQLNVDHAGSVYVKTLPAGTAVLSIGAPQARAAIFFPDLQTLWVTLIEAERQAAHLATEPPVDTTIVGNGSPS